MKTLCSFLFVIAVLVACKKEDSKEESSLSYSCITFNGNFAPNNNDTVTLLIDSTTYEGTVLGSDKAATWDFSKLTQIDSFDIPFIGASLVSNVTDFPDADIAGEYGALTFFKKNANGLEVLSEETGVEGLDFVLKLDETYNLFDYPMEYQDEFSDEFSLSQTEKWVTFEYEGATEDFDSITFNRHGEISKRVDGCGKLVTPNGTFDVLRVYKEETITDTIIGYKFVGLFSIELPIVNSKETYYSYEFCTDSAYSVYPIVKINLNANKEIQEVIYLK